MKSTYALKRFNLRGPLHTMVHWLLPTRARRGWRFGRQLRRAGIATPRPWAYAENRLGPLRFTAYLLTEYVVGEAFQRWIDHPDQHSASEWEDVAAEFGRFWRRMEELQLVHGDMKGTNFVIDADRNVWVLDLDSMRRCVSSWDFARARARDWARFVRNFGDRRDLIGLFQRHVR